MQKSSIMERYKCLKVELVTGYLRPILRLD